MITHVARKHNSIIARRRGTLLEMQKYNPKIKTPGSPICIQKNTGLAHLNQLLRNVPHPAPKTQKPCGGRLPRLSIAPFDAAMKTALDQIITPATQKTHKAIAILSKSRMLFPRMITPATNNMHHAIAILSNSHMFISPIVLKCRHRFLPPDAKGSF